MSKVFSPLTLGVGFTAVLALVPGLGLGSKAGAKAGEPTPALTEQEVKRSHKADAPEALLDQCLQDRRKAGPAAFGATVLTLPDPQRTHMAFWFDLRLNAVQRGFGDRGFLPRAFFLPWEAKSRDEGGQGVSSSYVDSGPGLIWFVRERSAADPPDRPTEYHALFIVGESQSLGLNREAMRRSLRLAGKLRLLDPEARITVLGPQFSGSLASLGAALEEHFRSPAAPPLRMQGTTTLSANAAKALRSAAGDVPESRLWISEWICNLSGPSKERLLDWYMAEAGWLQDASNRVAIFTEANTAYVGPPTPGGPLRVLFPMGLSRLRAERRAMEQGLAKGVEGMDLVLPSTLLGPSQDDALRVLDTLPQYSPDTVRNTELALAGTLLSLSRRGYTHIGISASDPEDLVFLAERVRAYHPSCTLFTTSGNHLLFAHPNFSAAMDGMVLVGGYPLTDAMRAVSLSKGELGSSARFTSEGEYAAYYATLLTLNPALAKGPELRIWGRQGFVSVVKGGSIWPLRHGGLEVTSGPGATRWEAQVEPEYLEGARRNPDIIQYARSRLRPLGVLLALLGAASGWVFLKPLLEVAGARGEEPSLRPYRDLAAGALLGLGILSLIAVGYLLPLTLFVHPPWRDAFLWLSLAAWAALLASTARALRGQWAWPRTLAMTALALLPALAVGAWGRLHFLEYIPGYLRFTSPGRGVSLLPTTLLMAGALALLLRAWFDVRRQEHPAFWPVPIGLAPASGLHLASFRKLQALRWIGLFGVGLAALQWALPGSLLRPLLEVQGIAALVVGLGGAILVASLILFWRLVQGWRELDRILEELDFSPYRAAFAEAGKLMNWNAMRALGRGLRTHRSSLRGRQILEAQRSWTADKAPAFGHCLAALEQGSLRASRGREAASDFARWRSRFQVAGLLSACGEALQRVCEQHPDEAAGHQEEVHLFYALRAITFIRQAFLVARYLLVGSLGSLLLLLLAVAAFDFQPKAQLLSLLGSILLVMAGWVTLRIVQMERNPLLCLMEGTAPDRVQLSLGLVENGLRFVVVPLLLLLATLNPSLGGMLVQVFNPLLHIMK